MTVTRYISSARYIFVAHCTLSKKKRYTSTVEETVDVEPFKSIPLHP